jgi:hypothetical protein
LEIILDKNISENDDIMDLEEMKNNDKKKKVVLKPIVIFIN